MSDSSEESKGKSKKLSWVISVVLIAGAFGVLYWINSTEPTAERESETLQRAMLVEVVEAERGTFQPVIVETGTVEPAKEIQLAPQVGGLVVKLHPDFTPGGFVEKGEVVLEIEPADYKNRLAQRQSELVEAKTDLALEMGRQEVAQRDFELLGERLPEGENKLVLREPQLEAAKTRIDAFQAAVDQAKLDLERTQLRSPFDAQILTRMANLGTQVSEGMPVAEIVGIEKYWVMATIPPTKLPFIAFPDGDEPGAEAKLYKRSASGRMGQRSGRLYRLIGELEPNTRLARVVIEVDDPLCRKPESTGLPPLLVGEFLEVHIQGEMLEDVVRIPIEYLRKNNTAWVMSDEDKLEIRELDIIFKDSSYAYLESGIAEGERIITSSLSRVTEGAELRVEDENTASNE
jgi:RND family efflux transporter MFP subunit